MQFSMTPEVTNPKGWLEVCQQGQSRLQLSSVGTLSKSLVTVNRGLDWRRLLLVMSQDIVDICLASSLIFALLLGPSALGFERVWPVASFGLDEVLAEAFAG